MPRLTKNTWVTQIDPHTRQEIAHRKLPKETIYEFVSRIQDNNGWWWLTIEVGGLWYEVQCPYAHLFSLDDCIHTTVNYEDHTAEPTMLEMIDADLLRTGLHIKSLIESRGRIDEASTVRFVTALVDDLMKSAKNPPPLKKGE